MYKYLLKTRRGLEDVAASVILEKYPDASVLVRPGGALGTLIVEANGEIGGFLEKVPEVEKVLPIHAEARASLEEMSRAASAAAATLISSEESFAVRTTRRGSHPFTSIDVNVAVGSAVQETTGAKVDLGEPDKVVWVEIFGERAFISITPGTLVMRKLWRGKVPVNRILEKLVVGQMPYLGPSEASYKMGVRIGREIQTFQLREVYIAHPDPIPGDELLEFLRGLFEGIESRYEIQRKTLPKKPRRTRVLVYDIYQLLRKERGRSLVISTSTKGVPISSIASKLAQDLIGARRILLLVGSREGLPAGVLRNSDYIVDVAPGVTIATDQALVASIIALLTAVYERVRVLEEDGT